MGEKMMIHLPARFLSAGQYVARKGWIYPEQTLDSAIALVVESGRFGIRVNQQRFILEPRQALLIPSGVEHAGFRVESDGAPVYYWAHFESRYAGEDPIMLDISPVVLPEMVYNRLICRYHQLMNANHLSSGSAMICDYTLSLLLLEWQGEREEAQRPAVVERMFEFIRVHCYERLTLCDLSRALGYSEDYLSRLFHEYANCSFRQYINQLRITRAKRELLGGVKTIQQIAINCGYSNARFFSTMFMKMEGVSPTVYRNMFSGIHQNNA